MKWYVCATIASAGFLLACLPGREADAAAAKQCRVSRTFDDSGFHVRMTVSNDGGSCAAQTMFRRVGGRGTGVSEALEPTTSGTVSNAPQHGTARLVFEPLASSVEYTPAAGYAGPDKFELRLIPTSRPWEVQVTVVP